MNRKIWKALGIAFCMLALAAPRAMAKTHEVWDDIGFKNAVQEINAAGDAENEIILMQDITLGGNYINYTLTNDKTTTTKTTTIKGEGHTISIKSKAEIKVEGEKTVLNLGANGYDKKLTIDGDTTAAFIVVSGGATAYMYENVALQNRQSTINAYVLVTGSDPDTGSKSVFNMNGGVIEGGSRAVIAQSGATFNMSGGEIRNCGGGRGSGNGGGVRVYEATFVMSDGTISGCSADTGGGLYADNSTINITGGTISGCKALSSDKGNGGGLYVEGSTLTIERGTISGCTARNNGGGLYAINSSTNSSTVNISGGTISGCKALSPDKGNGGGLYADNSTININGGTISGCKAEYNGGGLYATNSSIITINKSTISGCTATTNNGGGLYADNSTININGGTISGCEGRWGGGLYAENSSTITITDSTISGCKAGAGGGLFVNGSALNIKDGTISECFVSDTGKGGGLYAENNSILTISGGTIKGNKAAYGGGVALKDSRVKEEEPITSWTVVGNKAYKTDTGRGYIGGGIYLESGSMDVSDGSNRIYNNTADGHGADICLTDDTSSIKLPNAAGMGATYLDSGIYIDGWYNDDNPRYTPSESGVPVKVDGAEPLKGALSLVASYKAVPVRTVTIDTNGGKGGSGSQTVQKGTTITLEAPTKEGHLFKGWEDKEKGNSYPAGEDGKVKITVNENMTLTAVWEARTFTVTYVLLDGKTRTETAAYGETVTLVEEPRTGYTFVGWKDGEKMRQAGETITVTGNVTLTAVWNTQSFTVTYVLLDGKTRTETAAYGQNVTLVEEPRTGYTFVGWKDGENVYRAGETITVTGDMTLTAVWDTQSFTVTYVLPDGKTRTETAAYGKNVTLVEEPRTGYTFVGWNDGEKMRQAGETITVTGNVTLTAVWEARTFTVTYVLPDGKTRTETAAYGQNVTLVEEPRTGYTFVGWKDGEKVHRAGETITVTGNVTLTAVWKAQSFTVTYVLLDGKTRTETAAYGQNVTLVEEPRTGYTFVGWKDGEKMRQAGETITVTGDVTLTAVWNTQSFTVTYVLLDGKTRTETAAYGQTVTLVEEPRTGYTFVGWKDGEKVHRAGETITVTGDVTLTAEWKKLPSAENLPKTGDESPVLLWGAALAVSAAACFVLRRRK